MAGKLSSRATYTYRCTYVRHRNVKWVAVKITSTRDDENSATRSAALCHLNMLSLSLSVLSHLIVVSPPPSPNRLRIDLLVSFCAWQYC
eukprot:4392775-Ditylum_brightwellii.AAC.1